MKKLILFLTTLFLFSSCDQLLVEDLHSGFSAENYLQTEKDLSAQALGLYDFKISGIIYDYVSMQNRYFATRLNKYNDNLAYQMSPADKDVERIWTTFYTIINRANVIIKYAPNAPLAEGIVNQYIAEARFMRAYSYFYLVRLYGDLPLYSEPSESLTDDVLYKVKSPVSEVYKLITEDLIFAKDNLPKLDWANSPKNRVKAAGAYNLLGLVYLTMAGEPLKDTGAYTKAIETLEVLVNNKTEFGVALLANWHSNFENNNKVNSEKLFALSSVAISGLGSGLPRVCSPPGTNGIYANSGVYHYSVSYEFYQLFEPSDIRRQTGLLFTYTNNSAKVVVYDPLGKEAANSYTARNGISHTKYQDGTSTSPTTHTNDEFYMRFVESYLILAEAYCEVGNLEKAKEHLNVVRARAKASVITSNDQAGLRQIIRDERWRELFAEFTELFDMRRWGTVRYHFENHPMIQRWIPQPPAWDDKYLLYPIPSSELSRNPKLVQNKDW